MKTDDVEIVKLDSGKTWHGPKLIPAPHGGLLRNASPTILCLTRGGMGEVFLGLYIPELHQVINKAGGLKGWIYWSDVVAWSYLRDLNKEVMEALS